MLGVCAYYGDGPEGSGAGEAMNETRSVSVADAAAGIARTD